MSPVYLDVTQIGKAFVDAEPVGRIDGALVECGVPDFLWLKVGAVHQRL